MNLLHSKLGIRGRDWLSAELPRVVLDLNLGKTARWIP